MFTALVVLCCCSDMCATDANRSLLMSLGVLSTIRSAMSRFSADDKVLASCCGLIANLAHNSGDACSRIATPDCISLLLASLRSFGISTSPKKSQRVAHRACWAILSLCTNGKRFIIPHIVAQRPPCKFVLASAPHMLSGTCLFPLLRVPPH